MRRDVKPCLLASQDRSWEFVFAQFTQDEFLLRSTNLQVRGQLCGELHDAMIEERRAHFDGMSHAHAVAFHQNVVGQIIFLIEPQEVRQSVAGFRQFVYFIQEMVKSTGKRPAKQRLLFLVRKSSVPVYVSVARLQQAALQESLQLVFEADFLVRNGPMADSGQRCLQERARNPPGPVGKHVRAAGDVSAE